MAKQFTGTTRTLDTSNRSYRNVVFKPSKPPLDSELNFIGDVAHDLDKLQIQASFNSGWYPTFCCDTKGYDNAGDAFGVNFTNTPNQFIVTQMNGVPFNVNVNGETLEVGGTNGTADNKLVINLPSAPSSGTRQDLVFLEVWYQEVLPQPDTTYKPAQDKVWKFGNIEYGGTNPTDDMFFSPVGTDTTQRVQLQYRVRVVGGVDFVTFPDGVGDNGNVKAQANNFSATGYGFTRSGTDSSLYIAGDGSPTARTTLKSVDGFVYAIPMFRIHRRNTAAFSLLNLNGAGKTIAEGNSDRPDGFYSDKIELYDVEDLRYFLAINPNYDAMLYGAFHKLIAGELNTVLTESPLGAQIIQNGLGLHVDGMSVTDQTGVLDVAEPNSQRRVISDAATSQKTVSRINLSNRTSVFGIQWTPGDEFIVNLVGSNPTGTVFGPRQPRCAAVVRTAGVETIEELGVSVTPLGNTTLVFTVTSVPTGVTNQTLSVDYDILYPSGAGLTFVPEEMVKVVEIRDNLQYSFVADTDLDGIRLGSHVTSASAVDVIIGKNPQFAFTTEGFIVMTGNGTQSYTVGPTHGGVPITHVHYVAVNNIVVTRTSSPLNITEIRKNFDGSINILFNQAVPLGTGIQVAVGLANNAVSIQKKTKSVMEMSQIKVLSKTILAGSNVTDLVFETDGVMFSAMAELSGFNAYQSVIYIDDIATPCTTTLDGNFAVVSLGAAVGVGVDQTVEIVVNKSLALEPDQKLQVFYQYTPYQGVTARQSFGNGTNAKLETRIIARSAGFLVHTSGTNGLSNTVPDVYSPISVKLPKPFGAKDADLDNSTLGAPIFPTHKGLSLSTDFLIMQKLAINDFELTEGWTSSNADTSTPKVDQTRSLFGRPSMRFNKTGTSGVLGEIQKSTFNTNWSTIINSSGQLLAGKQLIYWFYIPDSSLINNVQMHLLTSAGIHVYQVSSGIQTGWNKATFVTRTGGSSASTTVTGVKFQISVNIPATVLYGFDFLPPYVEAIGSSLPLLDGDFYFASDVKHLFKFETSVGTSPIMDDGFNVFEDREYAFDDVIVSGVNSTTSTKVTPHVLSGSNFIDNEGGTNDRGTNKGSLYYSIGRDTLASVNKQAVVYLIEQVVEDQTGNFAAGEFLLRVETKITAGTRVEVSNIDFSSENSFDVFRLPGRPISKPLF